MKFKLIAVILSSAVLLFSTGCGVPNIEGTPVNTNISLVKKTVINDLLNTAENKSDHSLVISTCTLTEFNKYNMPMEICNRVIADIYISDVSEDIGISTLRKVEDYYYSVHTIQVDAVNNLYGFIMYNNEGKVIDGWCADNLKTESSFKDIAVDNTISDVYEIDPYCCYMKNAGNNTATTYHKLAKGKELVINYTRENEADDFVIITKQIETDNVAFTDMLLSKDMKLIKK